LHCDWMPMAGRGLRGGARAGMLGRPIVCSVGVGSVSAMDSTDSERCRSASEKAPSPTNCTVLFCHGSIVNALSLNLRAAPPRPGQRARRGSAPRDSGAPARTALHGPAMRRHGSGRNTQLLSGAGHAAGRTRSSTERVHSAARSRRPARVSPPRERRGARAPAGQRGVQLHIRRDHVAGHVKRGRVVALVGKVGPGDARVGPQRRVLDGHREHVPGGLQDGVFGRGADSARVGRRVAHLGRHARARLHARAAPVAARPQRAAAL